MLGTVELLISFSISGVAWRIESQSSASFFSPSPSVPCSFLSFAEANMPISCIVPITPPSQVSSVQSVEEVTFL